MNALLLSLQSDALLKMRKLIFVYLNSFKVERRGFAGGDQAISIDFFDVRLLDNLK